MIVLETQPIACMLRQATYAEVGNGTWWLRFRDCGLHAESFWESRIEP
jgi:hypothetical protein